MRVLITGHKGLIGRHFMRALAASGRVSEFALCDTAPLDNGARLDSFRDCRDFFRRSRSHYDLVIHAAAMVDGREAIDGKPALIGAYNLQLDGALFEWALRARPGRIVYFSSSASYPTGLQGGGARFKLAESYVNTYASSPDQTYGWVKLTGEYLAEHVRNAGVPVTVVRPFSGYGEDQDDCYPFPAMIARANRREDPFTVWGDGQQVRDFIHVDDIVAATLALVEQQIDGPVNLGTGVGTSMDDLARMAMRAAGYTAPIHHLSEKPAGVQHRVAHTDLLHRYYQSRITLEEGVQRAMALNPKGESPCRSTSR